MSTRAALLFGTLTVGTLDILDAIVFFGIRNHVAPIRIFQSIAAGLLGRAAFSGGIRTALLGALLHYFIAFSIVAVFVVHPYSRFGIALTVLALIAAIGSGVAYKAEKIAHRGQNSPRS